MHTFNGTTVMSIAPSLSLMPGHLIRRLNQQSAAVFQERMKEAGYDVTSVQFAALDTLEKHPELDQAGLAKRIGYDRATIGGVVKRLEGKGLVRRAPDPDDRRAFRLALSADGTTFLARLRPVVIALQEEILPGLTSEERAVLLELMKKALVGKESAS
ncbi:MarR family winged helix-turn-helix transcriptional regulator [Sulfitobacter sp.]|uniref:MarR family winged helix-turn-helix transcriptional regulator n=1 Tax=Sulfitobacter sp. TaxID=1903071 RepID=UPI00300381EA